AMADVAKANNVPFVDLFTPTLALYQSLEKPLTMNGVHLNEAGDAAVAAVIEEALFPGAGPQRDPATIEKLRRAVNDKNFYWFHRYRTTDGYSTYGDRAFLTFKPDNQSNYEVVQRELEILDLQTANRDKAVWAVARGGDDKPVDDNLPPFTPVVRNKPGPLPGGKHVFLKAEQEAIAKMTVHKGMKIHL